MITNRETEWIMWKEIPKLAKGTKYIRKKDLTLPPNNSNTKNNSQKPAIKYTSHHQLRNFFIARKRAKRRYKCRKIYHTVRTDNDVKNNIYYIINTYRHIRIKNKTKQSTPTTDVQFNSVHLQNNLKNGEKEQYKRKPQSTICMITQNIRGIYSNRSTANFHPKIQAMKELTTKIKNENQNTNFTIILALNETNIPIKNDSKHDNKKSIPEDYKLHHHALAKTMNETHTTY